MDQTEEVHRVWLVTRAVKTSRYIVTATLVTLTTLAAHSNRANGQALVTISKPNNSFVGQQPGLEPDAVSPAVCNALPDKEIPPPLRFG